MALAGQDGSRIDLEVKSGNTPTVSPAAPASGPPFIHTVFLGLITFFLFIIMVIIAIAAGESAFMVSRAMNVMQALPSSVPRTVQTLMTANIPALADASDGFADSLLSTLPSSTTQESYAYFTGIAGVAQQMKLFSAIVSKTNWVVPSAGGSSINGMVDMPFGEPVTTWVLSQMGQADIRSAAAACVTIASNLQGINFDQVKSDVISYSPDESTPETFKKTTVNDFVFPEGLDKSMQLYFAHMSQLCTALQSYEAPV
jgi:hypothetical protein